MSQISSRKMILRNLFSNYAMSFIGMALGFFLVPFLIKKLGKEDYGVVILVESVVMFTEIVSISIRIALSRYTAFALSSGDNESFMRYMFTGRRILRWAAAGILALGAVVSWYFPSLFHVPSVDADNSRLMFLVVTAGAVLSIWNIVYWTGLYAAQRHDLINIPNSLGLVFRAVLLFALFSFLPPQYVHLPQYGMVYLGMMILQNAIIYRFFRKLFPNAIFKKEQWDPAKVREILAFSVHTSVSRLSGMLYTDFSNVIINLYWGAAFNAIYSVALKIPTMFSKIFVEPGWVLASSFTDFVANNEHKKVETLLFIYSKIMSVFTFPLCAFILFEADTILHLWVGPDFDASSAILRIYTAHLFFAIPMSMVGNLFNAYGKVKWPSYVGLLSGVVNVVLVFIMGVWLKGGLVGVAWASVIAGLGVGKGFYSYYACRISGIRLRKYVFQILIRPIVVCGAVCGAFWPLLFSKLDWSHMGLSHILSAILMTLVCWGVAWLLVLSRYERFYLLDLIKVIIKRMKERLGKA